MLPLNSVRCNSLVKFLVKYRGTIFFLRLFAVKNGSYSFLSDYLKNVPEQKHLLAIFEEVFQAWVF